jgi:hypothetical protein
MAAPVHVQQLREGVLDVHDGALLTELQLRPQLSHCSCLSHELSQLPSQLL